jgi:uncharacterized protein YceH (UPF0502 family)
VLLLRGPQTPGELRGRTERMYRFEAIEDVQSTLQRLMDREPPLVAVLARQPGTKESRYSHLFSGEPAEAAVAPPMRTVPLHDADGNGRIASMEKELESLRNEIAQLRREFDAFKQQF